MKFEYKFGPKPKFDNDGDSGYFIKEKSSGEICAAYITGWTEVAQVIYFKPNYNAGGYKVTHSSIRHLKDCYTIVSEINRISFHEFDNND